jgi:hypothetical protein
MNLAALILSMPAWTSGFFSRAAETHASRLAALDVSAAVEKAMTSIKTHNPKAPSRLLTRGIISELPSFFT